MIYQLIFLCFIIKIAMQNECRNEILQEYVDYLTGRYRLSAESSVFNPYQFFAPNNNQIEETFCNESRTNVSLSPALNISSDSLFVTIENCGIRFDFDGVIFKHFSPLLALNHTYYFHDPPSNSVTFNALSFERGILASLSPQAVQQISHTQSSNTASLKLNPAQTIEIRIQKDRFQTFEESFSFIISFGKCFKCKK